MNNKVFTKTKLACGLALLFSSTAANALDCFGTGAGYCLQNGNAEFQVDSFGVMEMTVNGLTHVYVTDFVIAEHSQDPLIPSPFPLSYLDYMDLTQPQGTDPGLLNQDNLTVSTWGTANLSFELRGGDLGTNAASLIQTFTITNVSADAIDLGMFAFTDVDLGGAPGSLDDQGEIFALDGSGNPIAYRQFDAVDELITSVSIAPDFYEVGMANDCVLDICERVYFGVDTILANTIDPGPNDLQQAAQWNRVLASGESFTYTQTMHLNGGVDPIPVPAAVWLFGSGLLGLMGVARRKQQS